MFDVVIKSYDGNILTERHIDEPWARRYVITKKNGEVLQYNKLRYAKDQVIDEFNKIETNI